jgi:uncharacterized protein
MPDDPTGNGTSGSLLSIWRHPVKSMMGEELSVCEVTEAGLSGDRAYALIDKSDGKVVSAKNPRKWALMFEFRAAYSRSARPDGTLPAVHITAPDGSKISSDDEESHAMLSKVLGREVRLNRRERGQEGIVETAVPSRWTPKLEEYWPDDVEGLAHSGTVTDEAMPAETFFDVAPVHVLTTATLDCLQQAYPLGKFDVRRFRPNFLVKLTDNRIGFVENDWIGKRIQIGSEVQLKITGPCPRCVMTTLPQRDLPKDTGILRAAAEHNGANIGIYASVERIGRVRKGDLVRVL